ncbi:hypothetical protein HOLDEFILI_02249 [Holdemania filiformis DSM 12042]|uniref:Uncharacterized protein n=1 Tax=Holdemania filiformis DSM 12042 TaxID=545696 RepID=B9Y8U8_9FIRM|nr:hypothetical protein HOLDEFILI_02249 [Holdemania filiformis DSM 12042]
MIFQDHREVNDFIVFSNFLPAAIAAGAFDSQLFTQPGFRGQAVDTVPIASLTSGQRVFLADCFMRDIDFIINCQLAAA